MARLRNAPFAQSSATAPKGRPALREKTNTARAAIPVYEDDGNTEGLIKDAKPKRGRPKKAHQKSDDLVMAGGLGQAKASSAHKTGDGVNLIADQTTKDQAASQPASRVNRRPARTARKIVQSEEQTKVLEGLKQRMDATARERRAKQTHAAAPTNSKPAAAAARIADATTTSARKPAVSQAERSEFSLSPSPPPPAANSLNVVKTRRPSSAQPGSALRMQGTPAVETSILALKNFKRRPRQPSMLQMVQQRTASARPSTGQTTVADVGGADPSVLDLDVATDEEDDFAPEAEGTPLRARTARHLTPSGMHSVSAESTSKDQASRKRKLPENETSSGSRNPPRAKRRKSSISAPERDEIRKAPAPRRPGRTSSDRAETPRPTVTSDVQVANSPSSTPPLESPSSTPEKVLKDSFAIPSTDKEQVAGPNEPLHAPHHGGDESDGTMAEPASSSPAHALPSSTQADPLTQVSPLPVKERPRRRLKPMNTASLQAMLPRRRQPLKARPRRSEYDMESGSDDETPLDASHLEQDEDELGGHVHRKSKSGPPKPSKTINAKRGRQRKASASTGRESTVLAAAKNAPRTYGRAANHVSDKENEDYQSADEEEEETTLPEISASMEEVIKSKELEEARKKFAEVDEWDMEFESMSVDEHRSSSQSWR